MLFFSKNSMTGSVLLIAGSCIGAGMLGLPILTSVTGFWPALLMLCLVWAYMLYTALLLLEANFWFKNKELNVISIAHQTLGTWGSHVAWLTFSFLFYCLLVAYLSKGGDLLQYALNRSVSSKLPSYMGSTLLAIFGFLFVYFGTAVVDRFNRLAMVGVIVTYLFLIVFACAHIDTDFVEVQYWEYTYLLIPIFITAFGFHNMIPTIKTYLSNQKKTVLIAHLLGGTLPLFIYAFWVFVMQGVLPIHSGLEALQAYKQGLIATESLQEAIASPWIGVMGQSFAFFAIITSLFSQALSVLDFLADGFGRGKKPLKRFVLSLLTFLPPYLLALLNPNVFFTALEYAGGIAAVILFGLLPALIVWQGRYRLELSGEIKVFGGRPLLIITACIALSVLVLEVLKKFGLFTVL